VESDATPVEDDATNEVLKEFHRCPNCGAGVSRASEGR
jgi:ribosomal protein S27AE